MKLLNLFFVKLTLILTMLTSGLAFAKPESKTWVKKMEVGFEFPVYFGTHGRWNFYKNIYTRLGVGFASGVLLNSVHFLSFVNPHFKKDSSSLKLVKETLSNAFYSSLSLGAKLDHYLPGLYADFGYAFMLSSKELKTSFLNTIIPDNIRSDEPTISAQSYIHGVVGHIGYNYRIDTHITISGELGVIKPIYSQVKYGLPQSQNAQAFSKKTSKAHTDLLIPTISVWLAYTF